MKKILLILTIIIILNISGNAWADLTWNPSAEQSYHFWTPIVKGTDFNLTMWQDFDSPYSETVWGSYAGDWSVLDPCTGSCDFNLFKPPAGCELKAYYNIQNTCNKPSGTSYHEVKMTLNCANEGDYVIPTKYSVCPTDEGRNNTTGPEITFTVISNLNTPPFYDYNLFWSRVTPETTPVPPEYYSPPFTQTHYIHAWDLNEHQAGGQYYIKKFEVQLGANCKIPSGITSAGAKNLSKTANIGTWNHNTISDQHKIFTLDTISGVPVDANNMNLFVNVKCSSFGFNDFNITITDAEGNSNDLNTFILDLNSYKVEGTFLSNNGPPGVNAGGPYYVGNHFFIPADAYGVMDYATDTNYFIKTSGWAFCRPGLNWQCFIPSNQDLKSANPDGNCVGTDDYTSIDANVFLTEDYNSVIGGGSAGGTIQYIHSEKGISCLTSGHREAMFWVQLPPPTNERYLDVVDVWVLNLKSELKEPYYAVIDENTEILGIARDYDDIADIYNAQWLAYDDECGAKTEWVLNTQNIIWQPGSNGQDANVTGTIKCSTTGKKAVNLFITTKLEGTEDPINAVFRGDGKVTVILPDSIRLDAFEIVPLKVRKGNNVNFSATVKSKIDPSYPVDLNIEVQFEVFDEQGNLLNTIIPESQIIASGKQKTFSKDYSTTELKENSFYKVNATAFLVSGMGPIQDRQPINDILEDHFWVMTAEDNIQKLPETNFIGIILLISIALIILRKN